MREEGGRRERERGGGRKEGGNSSRRKPFSVHSLDPVLWKCEVPGPSDVVGREVADNRVATQQLAKGEQTEHDGSSSLILQPFRERSTSLHVAQV